MKRGLIIPLLIMLVSFGLWADMDLGNFPLGNYEDSNYDAYWSFSTGSISIELNSGETAYDFDGKNIEDFEVKPGTSGIILSFTCTDINRQYTLTKGLSLDELELQMVKADGSVYTTTLMLKN